MISRIFPFFCAIVLHGLLAWSFYDSAYEKPKKVVYKKVKISVQEKKVKEPIKIEKPEKPKAKPKIKKKKIKKQAKKKRVARKPKKTPKKNAKRVQGINKTSVSKNSTSSFSVPMGNTLMEEDRGLRLKADNIDELAQDLSQDPELKNKDLLKVPYTEDASDYGLEGVFRVEVFVDEKGIVQEAELERKIGFGMDAVVLKAAKSAKFNPRRNKKGQALAAWTTITFDLILE